MAPDRRGSGEEASVRGADPESETRNRRARQALDAVLYALAVAAVVFVAGLLVGVALGGGLVTAKHVLFVVGLALFGYGALRLRPDPPWDTERTEDGEVTVTRNDSRDATTVREETRFQAAVQRLPPASSYPLPPNERLSSGAKLFLASLAVLGLSFVLETVFGVGF